MMTGSRSSASSFLRGLHRHPAAQSSTRPSLSGEKLYAHSTLLSTYASTCRDEAIRSRVLNRPAAKWLGEWSDASAEARCDATASRDAGSLFCFVIYNIPNRDCGGYSAGGASGVKEYLDWVLGIASAVREVRGRGLFIVEPDALAHCGGSGKKRELVRKACEILRECEGCFVYVDIGHPKWHSAEAVAGQLGEMKIWEVADGFAVNVSNTFATQVCCEYGVEIVRRVAEKGGVLGFVVDTGRNGAGAPKCEGTAQWANPSSARLGCEGSTSYAKDHGLNDALHAVLWIKVPGESDGEFNGGPAAGVFWPEGLRRLMGY